MPYPTTPPRSKITTSSAAFMMAARCATEIIVASRRDSLCSNVLSVAESRAALHSSNSHTRDPFRNPRAIPIRCRCPPESDASSSTVWYPCGSFEMN